MVHHLSATFMSPGLPKGLPQGWWPHTPSIHIHVLG